METNRSISDRAAAVATSTNSTTEDSEDGDSTCDLSGVPADVGALDALVPRDRDRERTRGEDPTDP